LIKKTTIFTPEEAQTFETIEEFKDYCTLGGTKPDFKDQLIAGGIDITDDSVYQEVLLVTPDGTDLLYGTGTSMKITIAYADQEQLDSLANSYVDFLEELDYERPVYLTESTNHLF
jgi:hypothetical protein